MTRKKCNRCKVRKPRKEFSRNKCNKDGLQFYCKECILAIRRGYASGIITNIKHPKFKPVNVEDEIIYLRINTPRIGKLQHKITL